MKKKITALFLLLIMLVALTGIFVVSFSCVKFLLADGAQGSFSKIYQLCLSFSVLLVCWIALFVIFVKERNGGSFFDYGKKDILTGIGNSNYIKGKYKKANITYGKRICVSYISFDFDMVLHKFDVKTIEKLQIGAAKVITENCKSDEFSARMGAGSFAVVFFCNDGIEAEQKIADLINKLNKFEYGMLFESVAPFRAGICICDNNSLPFETVIENAKTAYEFANDDRLSTCVFSQSLAEKKKAKNNLKTKFLRAIKNEEFEMFLQWVYDSKTKTFVGAEALSRWNSPVDGFIMPAYYIHDMLTSGVIEKFDMYMIEKVCGLLNEWSKLEEYKYISISCNVTRATISSEHFLENFRKIIKKYNFKHNRLILEITEDAFIDSQTTAYRNISACKEEGFIIALDDFGSGTSSFADISEYPVDMIKVDRQFISKTTTKRGAGILGGFIEMAHNLDIRVVCEGVETEKQLDAVSELHTDFIQGYYFSYVYSVDEAKRHLSKFKCRA